MGLISFLKSSGEKLFGKSVKEAPVEQQPALKASALLAHIQALKLPVTGLKVGVKDHKAVISGEVSSQADAEKICLAAGNVEGVEAVENHLTVAQPAPESQFHTVVSGDSLSKISLKYYGDMMKYNHIFEANKPMLSHPDKIYPGQVLRIPPLQ